MTVRRIVVEYDDGTTETFEVDTDRRTARALAREQRQREEVKRARAARQHNDDDD